MEEVEKEESITERYAKMVKHDKLALLMIALGPDAASTLLKRLMQKIRKTFVNELVIFRLLSKN